MNKKAIKHILSVITVSFFIFLAFGSYETGTSTDTVTREDGTKVPAVEILQQTSEYESYTNSYTIHCRVKNNTDKLITYVDINATFYDIKGTIVGTGMGNTTNLAAGAEKTIDVLGLDIDNADKYEVQIDNIMY